MRGNIYIPKDTLKYMWIQKCSVFGVLEVFFKEPINLHFIKEISRNINLAHTSVRNNINFLVEKNLIIKKKSKPFEGYVANRENENFLFYKRAYNFLSLKLLKDKLIEVFYPNLIVVFGSYGLGEDIETSDIDILIVSKVKEEIDLTYFEEILKRKIRIIIVKNLNSLEEKLQRKISNGFVLYGSF